MDAQTLLDALLAFCGAMVAGAWVIMIREFFRARRNKKPMWSK